MIAYIKGEVAWIEEERIVLESGNIGYNIMMPASSFDTQDLVGKEVKIYTHLNVREDAMQLYGFLNLDELKTFRLLLGVNGIGPKAALGILSGLTTDELRFAVLSDDVKTISKAPGIGKKTAQKLILELKDKIDLEEVFETKQEHARETEGKMESKEENAAKKDAVDALTALGYSSTEALRAVRQTGVTQDMDVETILKLALKNMNL
ncbi:Holliday junction branch migration protein RuvA [Blautia stercoris]|uniref:Holliday junction branch migration protein RuvA n=1 Tax=Blautia stercoris TaxID=871664 RepID=UPI004024FD76